MTHTKASIQELLQTNDRAVLRAVVAIYKFQTPAEKASRQAIADNGLGFNSADAYILSARAKDILSGHKLTAYEIANCRHRIMKYSGQLLRIALKREAAQMLAVL